MALWPCYFSTPYITFSIVFSFAYIFLYGEKNKLGPGASHHRFRQKGVYLLVGEIHHPKRPQPTTTPRWLIVPDVAFYQDRSLRRRNCVVAGELRNCQRLRTVVEPRNRMVLVIDLGERMTLKCISSLLSSLRSVDSTARQSPFSLKQIAGNPLTQIVTG